jgi:CRISPR-associated protein (TIGR02584 family)
MSDPCGFRRRILLAVTGLSPQIVTETLYALAVQQQPPFMPTEIHLITTQEGANRARLSLLSESPGGFHGLRKDYNLPEIAFPESNIHVLTGADGEPLEDIRTPEENLRAADFITEIVRQLTVDTESAVHVSMAGGRKTMGFFVAYALTLFGRPQDRLSHVLVSPPFESSYQFFYPTPYTKVIEVGANKLADTAMAEVTLADIPFVSLRHGLPEDLQEGRASYNLAYPVCCQSCYRVSPLTAVECLVGRC